MSQTIQDEPPPFNLFDWARAVFQGVDYVIRNAHRWAAGVITESWQNIVNGVSAFHSATSTFSQSSGLAQDQTVSRVMSRATSLVKSLWQKAKYTVDNVWDHATDALRKTADSLSYVLPGMWSTTSHSLRTVYDYANLHTSGQLGDAYKVDSELQALESRLDSGFKELDTGLDSLGKTVDEIYSTEGYLQAQPFLFGVEEWIDEMIQIGIDSGSSEEDEEWIEEQGKKLEPIGPEGRTDDFNSGVTGQNPAIRDAVDRFRA